MTAAAVPRPAAWHGPWLRLRALRVERARAALRAATQAETDARDAVTARQARIAQHHAGLAALARGWSGTGSAALPRWGGAVTAWRAALEDRLERDAYALIDEERTLEQAQDATERCRAALVRAMAREEAVGELVRQARRTAALDRERHAEREQEAQRGALNAPRAGRPGGWATPTPIPSGNAGSGRAANRTDDAAPVGAPGPAQPHRTAALPPRRSPGGCA